MNIRRAEEKDTNKILDLLSQVLELHAAIRPDTFIPGTTKYSREELKSMFCDEQRRIYVAADEKDSVLGYAFCEIRHQPPRDNMVQFRSLYIDDLCVLDEFQGQGIGSKLCDFIFDYGNKNGFDYITLNVWSGNESAISFYENKGFSIRNIHMEKRIGDLNEEN